MNVGQICSRDVDLVELDEGVVAAARRMLERRVGTLVAVDESAKPVGLVTDRDLALRVLASQQDPSGFLVRDIVTTPVHTVHEDASTEEAVVRMSAASCRRLAVVDPSDRLVGVLSIDDVLEAVAQQMRNVAELIEHEAPHRLVPERAARA